jgi:hypothetical protein
MERTKRVLCPPKSLLAKSSTWKGGVSNYRRALPFSLSAALLNRDLAASVRNPRRPPWGDSSDRTRAFCTGYSLFRVVFPCHTTFLSVCPVDSTEGAAETGAEIPMPSAIENSQSSYGCLNIAMHLKVWLQVLRKAMKGMVCCPATFHGLTVWEVVLD